MTEHILSWIVFIPLIGMAAIMCVPRGNNSAVKMISLVATGLPLVLATWLYFSLFDKSSSALQFQEEFLWIDLIGAHYFVGVDGLSLALVWLTTLLLFIAVPASFSILKAQKAYYALLMLLEVGILGVFVSMDYFLFYVFWEVMLLPMYFLIGVWGGPRKEYAAIKFFLYTLVGSVLMLIAILMLYFNSDLTRLDAQQLANAGILQVSEEATAEQALSEWTQSDNALAQQFVATTGESDPAQRKQLHTFNILALQQMGQHTDLFDGEGLFGKSIQWWAFLLLFIGFVIKVPSVPLHTWLPDAHVEAPTPISMILAGVLLKMGGYGIIRICYPICPGAGYELAYFVCFVGVVSMVYGAFAALAQKDFKRMVAYSSVSHMGYVVLGLGVWSAVAGTGYNPDFWKMGANGAMFQMIAHGISSAGMFFMVGVIYDRVHHRNLDDFGGLFAKMPVYSGLAIGIFFAGLGLPGLCGFIGEVLVVLSVWKYSTVLAVISAAVVILTAGYILWAIQRVYLGAEYKGPHGEALVPITMRELLIATPLLVMAIVFGVYPNSLLRYMQPSVDRQIENLASWTQLHDERETAANPLDGEDGQMAAANP